jgi:hypothetical protein
MSSTFVRDFLGRLPGVSCVGDPRKSLDELDLPDTPEDNRRVAAVVRYLRG